MHLSLYRRFRPDTFDKMVRQEHVVRVLKNQIASGAIGHAYLFCGPRGTGKTSVARIFARAVNCEHPVDGSPCGKCPSCIALAGGSLDVTEIDAASNNGVNEMRDLREKVQYPPVSGKYKVYIIDEVHMLTDSAFNALLKTLEEPPAHAIFILATTEPHKIPATILSRCMRLDFKLIPEEDLERHLAGILDEIGKPYEPEAVAAIARAGAGSDRDMLSIAEMCVSYSEKLTYESVTAVLGAADFSETCALCASLLRADLPATLERAERILAEGKAVGVLCRDMLEMLNRIAVVKTCRTAEKLLALPKTQFGLVREAAEEAEGGAILRASEILGKTETDLRFVSSPRICLETALMKIATPAADADPEALLVRIAALEKKVEQLSLAPRGEPAPLPPRPAETPAAKPAVSTPAAEAPRPAEVPAKTAEVPTKLAAVPEEEPVGCLSDDLYDASPFDAPAPRPVREEAAPPPRPVREEAAPPPRPAVPAEAPADAGLVYGKFVRLLRKTSRNGVLFTMCNDLEAAFEGEKLVLYTASGTVFRALGREEHRRTMADLFAELGVSSFEVRMKGEPPAKTDAAEQLKRDFRDYPVEIKK